MFCAGRGLTLCPVGLTGPQVEDEQVAVDDGEVRVVFLVWWLVGFLVYQGMRS